MRQEFAVGAKRLSLDAMRCLFEIAKLSDEWDSELMKRLRKAIGTTIGKIEVEILGEIYKEFKELDDLRDG